MALTRFELVEQVKKIWGQTPPRAAIYNRQKGGWEFTLSDGSHSVDGNGHVDCHERCKALEVQVTMEPSPETRENAKWVEVAPNTKRLKVPGGWLYKTNSYYENTADVMCFVPYYHPR